MSVRVVVDASALGDGSSVRGIGSSLRPLCAGLAERADLDLVLMTPTLRGPGRFRAWEHLLTSGVAAKRARPQVAWFPANLAPILAPRPFVATVHDVIPLQFTDEALERDRRRWRVFARHLRKAATVISPSHATADAVQEVLRVKAERSLVIPWGVGNAFVPEGPKADVDSQHILWVSAYDAHKGLAEACSAIAGLAARNLPHRLRLVGPFDEWNRAIVERVVAASPRPDLVDVVGWVDDLPAAYRAADAFVITSRCEGFGLPPVEAQACGTPVVGFRSPGVTEVAGPGARLVGLGDVNALVDALAQLLNNADASAELRAAGLANAQRFSWSNCIDAYADALTASARLVRSAR